jgi:uncharacterized protein with GYD domain
MSTFILFGNYSTEAFKGISADRTEKAQGLAKKYGGELKHIYALLGKDDLVIITEFPSVSDVMKFSISLSSITGINFTTASAVSADEFDKLIDNL